MPTPARGGMLLFVVISWLMVAAGAVCAQQVASHGPQLTVTMLRPGIDSRPLIAPGQTVTVSIGISNLRGDQGAHDTVLSVLLPPGLTLKQSRPPLDSAGSPADRPTWRLGTVDAGALPQVFELDLQAGNDVMAGKGLGVAAVVSTGDREQSDEGNSATAVFLVAKPAANLVTESNLGGVPFTADNPVEFTVEVTNLGTVPAAACVLKLTLPARVSFTSSSPESSATNGNVVTWQIGDLAAAETRSVTVRITLDGLLRAAAYGFAPALGSLNFIFDATTTTDQLDPASGHLEVDRYAEPAGSNVEVSLNVPGVPHPGELLIGKDATIEIIYGNFGNAPASKATVALTLPKGLDFVGATPAAAHSNKSDPSGPSVVSWDLGDLRVGESSVIRSHIQVTALGADGSLVSAAIAAEGNDVPSREKTAYSLQRAAKSDTHVAGALPREAGPPRGGARRPWVVWIVVIVLVAVVVLAIVRAISKRNLNT